MRRALLVLAAGIVLMANGWGVFQASRNRGESLGGIFELTERELPLEMVGPESTAIVLRIDWSSHGEGNGKQGPPAWLNTNKLAELGFDLKVAPGSPNARNHYSSMPGRPVSLVMEYAGEAWRAASPKVKARTRLFVVDAGLDPRRLRERYPDAQRYVICRGSAGLLFRDRDPGEGTPLETPRIEGRIESLRPGQVFVPLPKNHMLTQFRRNDFEETDTRRPTKPRYAVRVAWGANYEPWVQDVRLLATEETQGDEP